MSLLSDRTCVVCDNMKCIGENITLFTKETLQEFHTQLKIRKKHELEYSSVALPSEVNGEDGYHTKCYRKFLSLSSETQLNIEFNSAPEKNWILPNKKYDLIAYEEVYAFIDKNIIENGKCYYLTYFDRYYCQAWKYIIEINGGKYDQSKYCTKNLERRIKKKYRNRIKIFYVRQKRVIAPINYPTEYDEAELYEKLEDDNFALMGALILRKRIFKYAAIEDHSTRENLITEELNEFFITAAAGLQFKLRDSEKCINQAQSLSRNLFAAVMDNN